MTESEAPAKRRGISGAIFVIGFGLFCLLIAAGSLVTTIVAQNNAPAQVDAPPEIGHEILPGRD
ncbi:MAG: hypothetical protein AB8H79_18020 [Myxococcota bacterium]